MVRPMLLAEQQSGSGCAQVLAMGPKALIVKHGEYGATAFFSDQSFPGRKVV